ncbi:MAG TPA: flagellin [Gemmataceae bacterium]|nr:flagellin [Gemmataceae bacterium]
MSLVITNNVSSLQAQNNFARTNSMLSKTLERLSSGLKINSGADGPAALVISEQQRAQIAGLNAALANTTKAISLVQTGEGALNEVNSLLNKARSLALDAANAGVNDQDSLDADEAELSNIISTVDSIANRTQFGSKKLLDGTAGAQNFQIGANAGDTATVTFLDARTTALGIGAVGVVNPAFTSLSTIHINTTAADAADSIRVIDKAIEDVTTMRGTLGAFQANTLESTSNNLRTMLQNTTVAESTVRDTDFALETSNLAKYQVLAQAGAAVLSNSNQSTQLVLALLQKL